MRRPKPNDAPEELRQSLIELLTNFAAELEKSDLRAKVVALVPAFHKLRDLGSSFIPHGEAPSARDRIIAYLKRFPNKVIDGDELMVVSGISLGTMPTCVSKRHLEALWQAEDKFG